MYYFENPAAVREAGFTGVTQAGGGSSELRRGDLVDRDGFDDTRFRVLAEERLDAQAGAHQSPGVDVPTGIEAAPMR
jgi:hypothetical protein